jgi:DNA-binding Lrp family transcriptional regulator
MSTAMHLDRLDRRILYKLDCDSRIPLSELARSVKLGRDLVSYRIERLRSIGVLNKCTALVNPYKLGFTVYKTYLKLEAHRSRWSEFVSHLNQHSSTSWLAECYGKWDVVWCVYARTPKEVYDLQDKLFSEYRDIIIGYNVCTLVNYWRFPKKYIVGECCAKLDGWQFESPEFTFGTTPLEHSLDDVECSIVKALSEDARMPYTELAKIANTSVAVVRYRIEKLEELGVIAGYRVDVNKEALGMTSFQVQVHPRELDAEQEVEFHAYCRTHPMISGYVLQLGDCKLEFTVEAKDYAQFNAVMDEIRQRFSGFIRTLDYMMVKQDYYERTPSGIYSPKPQMPMLQRALVA